MLSMGIWLYCTERHAIISSSYLSLYHEVSLAPHTKDKVEDVHPILLLDHLHH